MKSILKKIGYNLLFVLIFSLLLSIANWILSCFSLLDSLTSDDFYIVFFLLLIGVFFRSLKAQLVYYVFIYLIFLIETLHWSYYGTPILPAEIYKFFTDFDEVAQGMGSNTFMLFIKPFMCSTFLFAAWFIVLKKIHKICFHISYFWITPFLALGILTYNASLEQAVWKSQKSDQSLVRSGFETIASFFGKYLPTKLTDKNYGGVVKPLPQKINPSEANIILIFGESLTFNHMSLFGYNKQTTPHLDSLYKANAFYKKRAVPAGTCTDVSLLSFFNQVDSIGQYNQIENGNHFLFKLAKEQRYQTYFITTQSYSGTNSYGGQMNKKLIDYFLTASDINPTKNKKEFTDDVELVAQLKKALIGDDKKMIVMQMYGSHEQYNERYPKAFNYFKSADYKYIQTAEYDNSVLYTDYVLAQLVKTAKENSTKPTYFFFISDHGENAGEDDVFGHNMFRINVLSVPMIYQTYNNPTDTLCNWINKYPYLFTQHKLSQVIGRLLGYDYKPVISNKTIVNGMDIGGLDGYARITVTDSVVKSIDGF